MQQQPATSPTAILVNTDVFLAQLHGRLQKLEAVYKKKQAALDMAIRALADDMDLEVLKLVKSTE